MRTNEAIVLAGGLGTRLHSVLPDTSKCMASINGKPFLTYLLDYLLDQGINKVILSVGYRSGQIISHFKNRYRSLDIEYAIEEVQLGTGGAINFALNYVTGNEVFVINGDTFFTPDLQLLEECHLSSNSDATIAVKYMTDTSRYGLVITEVSGLITEFREKDPDSENGWINGGIYLVNRNIFNKVNETKFSIEDDVFKKLSSIMHFQAFKTDAFFLDIGIPDDYQKAQILIKSSNF
jgi:D-glycero-alpha-D-manno-heptose 1-phosphate guanylyltransferase